MVGNSGGHAFIRDCADVVVRKRLLADASAQPYYDHLVRGLLAMKNAASSQDTSALKQRPDVRCEAVPVNRQHGFSPWRG